ncbi:MAG: single-stranded-DNA-specific exonuclease RecJ [Chloroflexi bacterium]|nr:single-stranded-DNA-specific exonuclease RecJ [Chloroflexota bacterium]
MTASRWILRRAANPAFTASNPNMDPLLAAILWARRIDTPSQVAAFFTEPSLDSLGDPFTMAGAPAAVERLVLARERSELVAVYGDFDADGISATALMSGELRRMGLHVRPYIPDRFNESYGLNDPALEQLAAGGVRLVVTVDCGIRSVNEAETAARLGLDLIISDHHSVPDVLPRALATIDPKQPGCSYPFKELSGVGVAYQLLSALSQALGQGALPREVLELVALGTVSDIVPLVDENRTLVTLGLDALRNSSRPGLLALMQAAQVQPDTVDSQAIGFRLGPRINAAGRLANAAIALQLLTTNQPEEAAALAQQLSTINQERQSMLQKQVCLAEEILADELAEPVLFAAHPEFHEGLVGLVASRLCEQYYRPALVFKQGEQSARGSARSIEGVHITQALDQLSALLEHYGGHARAAGMTVPNANLEALRSGLSEQFAAASATELYTPRILVDAIVPLRMVTPASPRELRALEPTGEANPEPSLATLGLTLQQIRTVGADGQHLRLQVSDGQRSLPAIAFRQGARITEFKPGQAIDLIYQPSLDSWLGQETLQLVVSDVRAHQASAP